MEWIGLDCSLPRVFGSRQNVAWAVLKKERLFATDIRNDDPPLVRGLPLFGPLHYRLAEELETIPPYNPNSPNPACPSGRGPNSERYFLSASSIGRSLMLARRRCIKPLGLNSQFSLP